MDGKHVPASDQRGFVSVSSDGGRTWQTSEIDARGFAPGVRQDPYTSIEIAWCHPNFVEQKDGTVFFSLSMRYDDWDDFSQADQSRPGIRDVRVRTADGGKDPGETPRLSISTPPRPPMPWILTIRTTSWQLLGSVD